MMTKHNLARWLMKEVRGIDIGIKSPRARRKGPQRDSNYRAWVRSLECAVCGSSLYVEAAHTGHDGGMRQKSSDYSCIPLCIDCHQSAPYSYHRIGRRAFAQRYSLNIPRLVGRLNWLWFNRGKQAA